MTTSQYDQAASPELATILAALATLEARVQAQEDDIQQLRATQSAQRAAVPTTGTGTTSRRGMLKTALGAAIATMGAGAVLERQSGIARADGTEGPTLFSTSGAYAVAVQCTDPHGTGISIKGPGADASDYYGVSSNVTNGIGVRATSVNATSIEGISDSTADSVTAILGVIRSTAPGDNSSAVRGQNNGTSNFGFGVWGSHAGSGFGGYFTSAGGIGVNAAGGSGTGVNATGDTIGVAASSIGGRGGVFVGTAAQVQLTPGSAATHPASGAAGDLYVDSTARLWFCQGGTTWVNLTATTTVAIAAGWNLIGVTPGSAGLMASHVLSTLLAATGGTLAALYGLTNGHWTPSFIVHNAQTIGTDFPLAAGHGYLLFSDMAHAGFTLQAPVQVSAVTPGGHPAGPGQGGGMLPPAPILPGQR